MHGNRRVRATLGTIALLATPWRAHAADAPAPDLATIATGLEAPDATSRAQAAEALAARYPEAAVAVPVLLDAVRDEDARVRAAAVRTLRILGRHGQDDAAQAWTSMRPGGLAHHDDVFHVVLALGAAVTPTDLAVGFAEACAGGTEVIRAALLGLAILPLRPSDGEFATTTARRDQHALLAVASPWLRSSDAATARTAAAVVTILGRSGVADVDRGAPPEDRTASSPALLPLLGSNRAVVQFAAWRLVAIGAPHAAATHGAVLAAAGALPARDEDGSGDFGFRDPLRIHRDVGVAAVRSLGAAARPFVLSTRGGSAPGDGARLAVLLDVEARDEARAAWAQAVATWQDDRRQGRTPDMSVAFAIGRDPGLASDAAASLPTLLDAERKLAPPARELLALVDPQAPPDEVPAEAAPPEAPPPQPERAAPCLALAWLAHRVPPERVGEGLRVRTAAALRRALVLPGRPDDRRLAAAVLVDLGLPGLVPASTLVAALTAEGTRKDPMLTAVVLAALAAVGSVPASAVGSIARHASTATPAAYEPTTRDRLRYAAGWPYVLAALELRAFGAAFEERRLRRLAAIDALGAVTGDKARAKAVLSPLTKDPDARVRYRAAKALRRLGG